MSRSTSPVPKFSSTPLLRQQIVQADSLAELPPPQSSPARAPQDTFLPKTLETMPPPDQFLDPGTPFRTLQTVPLPADSLPVAPQDRSLPRVAQDTFLQTLPADQLQSANLSYNALSGQPVASMGFLPDEVPQTFSRVEVPQAVQDEAVAAAAQDDPGYAAYMSDSMVGMGGHIYNAAGTIGTRVGDHGSYIVREGLPSVANHTSTHGAYVAEGVAGVGSAVAGHARMGASQGANAAQTGATGLFRALQKGGEHAGQGLKAGADATSEGIEKGNVGLMFLLCGVFGLTMLVLIPIWDGNSLLDNPVWQYMFGSTLPVVLIICSFMVPLFFVITIALLLKCGRRSGSRSEETMFGAGVLFILLLGSMLVTISSPIAERASYGKWEFTSDCQTGPKTRPLYLEYQALQKLRGDAACAKEESVEKCSGFKETSHSLVLKHMEKYLSCSGFCFYPSVGKTANASAKSKFLLQLESQELGKRRYSDENATSIVGTYPPALFTKLDLQGSCSAMAARSMESFVGDTAKALMYEGFFLIAASIVQGFLMILGLVTRRDHGTTKRTAEGAGGYGAIEAPYVGAYPTAGTGDFRRRQFAQ